MAGGANTVRLALEDAEQLERIAEEADANQWQDWAATMRQAAHHIRAALANHSPDAGGVEGEFLPMEAWDKRDETVLLLVDYSDGENPLDDALTAITIGHNNDHNVGDGEGNGWEFAGWNWQQDYYTHGRGKPIGWMPIPHHLAALNPADAEGGE
ncbi:hypothetical protein LH128_05283 [Sphingomonas sp. LH128]|nr:hypothetical protein LH128_05283 [Sphingomonas sp. LH128]